MSVLYILALINNRPSRKLVHSAYMAISQVQVIADLQPTIRLTKPEDTEEALVTIANVKKKATANTIR